MTSSFYLTPFHIDNADSTFGLAFKTRAELTALAERMERTSHLATNTYNRRDSLALAAACRQRLASSAA